jgi:hypothetical protein
MTQAFEQRVLDHVRSRSDNVDIDAVIVYLCDSLRHAGEQFQIGDVILDMPWNGWVAFIDLEPGVNWGHSCAYLAIRHDGEESRWFAAGMPPFLKSGSLPFRLLRCGPQAPEWAVASNPE